MALRDRLQTLFEGDEERGTKPRTGWLVFLLILVSMVGWTFYSAFLMPPYKPQMPVQTAAYTTNNVRPIEVPPPIRQAEMPAPRPQAQSLPTPTPQPQPRPVPKQKTESEEEKYRKKARLMAHYSGPFDQAWRKLAGEGREREQAQESRQTAANEPPQVLEVPSAQRDYHTSRDNAIASGNVWNRDFYQRGHGQTGVLQPPQSPYMVMRGSVIPVRLLDNFDTQTPGQITATVTQDIRDTRTGRYVLIPAGSLVIGGYGLNLPYDQDRIPAAWDELQLPSGETMALSGFPSADENGAAGMPVEVNTHFWKTAGRSLLLTLSGAASQMAWHNGYSGNYDASDALAQSGGQELNRRSRQMWDRGGYRGPTGTAKAGQQFLLQVTSSLEFPPGDYYERNGGMYANRQ